MNTSLDENSGAMRLIKTLLNNGIDTFFGVPGGPICPVFEALRLIPEAKLIESRHETHAALSAASFYNSTGKVPAVVVTAGPGITNVVTGIASAYLEQIPMMLISGDVSWSSSGGILAQNCGPEGIHIEKIFSSITNDQVRISNSKSVVSQTVKAIKSLNEDTDPRPVLLVAPLDITMSTSDDVNIIVNKEEKPTINIKDDTIKEVVDMLLAAERPLLVLGGATKKYDSKLKYLMNFLTIPFMTTPRAKGVLSENSFYSLRNSGMAASLWARNYTKQGVDVALVLGTDLDDTSIGPTPYIGKGGKLIHVDINSSVFNRNLPTKLGIQSDIETFIDHFVNYCIINNIQFKRYEKNIIDVKSNSPYDVECFRTEKTNQITPQRTLADVQSSMPSNTRFITDIGEHMLFALHYLTAESVDSFNIQLNLGSMGSGIAGAIGLSLANKSKPVVCICGDGGMQMTGMEVLTAIKEQLPIIYLIFNDGRYNMVHHGMKQIFGEAVEYDTQLINFSKWADSMGLNSAIITKPGQINKELISSLQSNNNLPIVLDVRIDKSSRIKGGGRVEALQHMSMLSRE